MIATLLLATFTGFVNVQMPAGCQPNSRCVSFILADHQTQPLTCAVTNAITAQGIGDDRLTLVPTLTAFGRDYGYRLTWFNQTNRYISPRMAVAYYDCR